MSKTKYQRGLCVWHGCKNVGTVEPNEMQRFCQEHWQPIQQDNDLHEAIVQAARKRIANLPAPYVAASRLDLLASILAGYC